jgi:hypothetical protein
MSPAADPPEALEMEETFDAVVDRLRRDFHRVFPHLRPREHEAFFVERNPDGHSGKVWIEFIKSRNDLPYRCRITIIIEHNRATRRTQDEIELDEAVADTSLICP